MKSFKSDQYIVAIGASAGGIEAIQSFFDHTPTDGISYIIIQHLSPDYKSRMAEILAPHSKLDFCEVKDGTVVQVNKVYMVPNTKYMTIEDGKLRITEKAEQSSPHMTINTFFISLAAERGDKAIGVILSGTGKDGALGVEAIQKAGGMVLVQDPLTTKFDGMPSFAISTGCADAVLAPELMPEAIEQYLAESSLTDFFNFSNNGNGDDHAVNDIINLIKNNLPLDFSNYKLPTILRRIKRRMLRNNFSNSDKYLAFLQHNAAELELLANDFLIGVTSFFRDPEAFEFLKKNVIPRIVENNIVGEPIKIWVAGCATGEEAYSLAILMREYLDFNVQKNEVKIFATDLSMAALDYASKGRYPQSIADNMSAGRLEFYFSKEGNTYKIKPELRKMVVFAHHDLVKNPPYCSVDLISCRNLLIYMNPVLQKKIVAMFNFGLKENGYLFLGSSENGNMINGSFEEMDSKFKIFRNKKPAQQGKFNVFSPLTIGNIKPPAFQGNSFTDVVSPKFNFTEDVNDFLMNEYGCAGVCIDENLNVIQAFGELSKYLDQKIFKFNLSELMSGDLSTAFGATLNKALKLNKKVILKDIYVKANETGLLISLTVYPFVVGKTGQKMIMVLFAEGKNKKVLHDDYEVFNRDVHTKEYIASLEEELANTKENLATTYERIESANENLQSFNEELLSASEEMQSANEEMQSLNEELTATIAENLAKIQELNSLNDDLNNYFRSNMDGQLFVDKNLLLKKYSPAAVQHINVKESDIGRPISNLSINIKLATFIEDIKKVVETGDVIFREAKFPPKNWYHVMITPYIRQADNKTAGAIITFHDITELKNLQKKLEAGNKVLLKRVYSTIDEDTFISMKKPKTTPKK